MFFSPGKWAISPLNLPWLTDPHDLQGIPTPTNKGPPVPPHLYNAAAAKSKAFHQYS
jgi:hypothetical protein